MPLQPGDKLGPYEIVSELGRGGMATVYKARQHSMDREVAIKVLPEQFLHDPTFLARFTQEARVIARLEHPRILPVHDFGEAGGVPYIVMRLMPVGTLRDRLRTGPLPVTEVAHVIGQVAEALDYAHGRGVIHRDLKPDNVLVDEAGNAYLTDFGIAKVMAATMAVSGTLVAGTPSYMAPEQVNQGTLSPQTDQYALGAMAFELLTSRPPFVANNFVQLAVMHATELPPKLADVQPGLPESLQPVIERALAKSPEARYANAREFAAALAEAARKPAFTTVPPVLRQPERPMPTGLAPALGATPGLTAPPGALPPSRPATRWNAVTVGGLVLGGGTLALAGILVLAGLGWVAFRYLSAAATPVPTPAATQVVLAPTDFPTQAPLPTQTATESPTESPTITATRGPIHTVGPRTFMPQVPRVSLADAKAAFDAGSAVFVDVRERAAYDEAHIPDSLSMPLGDLENRLDELDPNQWIITYCT